MTRSFGKPLNRWVRVVDGVAGDDEDSLKTGGDDRVDDRLQDSSVLVDQVQAGFTGLPGNPGRDYHHVGVICVRIATSDHPNGAGQWGDVSEVDGVPGGLLLVPVNDDQLVDLVG